MPDDLVVYIVCHACPVIASELLVPDSDGGLVRAALPSCLLEEADNANHGADNKAEGGQLCLAAFPDSSRLLSPAKPSGR